jgi:protein-L-isoaspartate(D-aspartate) O-methyltransferase
MDDSKRALIAHLRETGALKTAAVVRAFEKVPREEFVPESMRKRAYDDEPLPIGSGQTISAPHMVAMMTELLEPRKTDKVLEVGAGSGYQAAILSHLVRKVYTVELVPELAESAERSLERAGCRNVEIIVGDGSMGYPEAKPFDKAIATCACPEIPEAITEQLKEGGRVVIPVGSGLYQDLIVGIKKKGRLEETSHGGCVFVPLRH